MTELTIIVKVTVVMGVALVGAYFLRRTRASVRHLWLACTFGVVLVLPVAALLEPPLTLKIPITGPATPTIGMIAPLIGAPELSDTASISFPSPLLPRDEGRHPAISTLIWLRMGWTAGSLLFLMPIGFALWCVGRLRRTGLPWLERTALIRTLAIQAGVNRQVTLLLHEDLQTPATFGHLWPAILLPADAPAWSGADIERALVHELEHVRRMDWLVHLVARVVTAVYWFHPLVWIAWRLLCLDSERACDDAVLRGAEPADYAEQLLTLARRLSPSRARPLLSMASRSDLSARVAGVLDSGRPRGQASRLWAVAMTSVSLVVVLVVSPLRAVSRTHQETPSVPAARTAIAQATAPPSASVSPSFEVASIKPNNSGDTRWNYEMQPGGRFRATGVSLANLISIAYGAPFPLSGSLVLGGPDWMKADRFDVLGKAEGNPTQDQFPLMLRPLLADRFKLRVHRETRERDIFALVMANGDRRLGPRLRRTDLDCTFQGATPPAPVTPATTVASPCIDRNDPGQLTSPSITMPMLARLLRLWVEGFREVRDETGLTGSFEVALNWTPDLIGRQPADAPLEIGRAPVVIDPNGPSLFTAVQEQLGLKLASQRGQVEVVVVDHAEQPTDNQTEPAGPPARSSPQAQSPTTPTEKAPAFEVASVKPNKSLSALMGPPFQPGGRFTMTNRTLKALILFAYSGSIPLQDDQISGGPNWIDSDRFDVVAKMEGDLPLPLGTATVQRVRLMLRTLLADRFRLTLHMETRDLPVYALTMASSDGRLGPQLRRSDIDCTKLPPPPSGPLNPDAPLPLCNFLSAGSGLLNFRGVPIGVLSRLAANVGRLVIDRTGLTGNFDLDLTWTPDQLTPGPALPAALARSAPDSPSIFTAVQEQLGLRLESTRAPVDVLVIDRAEQPTPD